MRTVFIALMMILVVSFFVTSGSSCMGNRDKETMGGNKSDVMTDAVAAVAEETANDDNSGTCHYDAPVVPDFVQNLMEDADWSADTICVANGKAYYFAYEVFGRMLLIYNDDEILVADPTLHVDSFASGSMDKFYVSVSDKCRLIDFSDAQSLQNLASLSLLLPSFTRYRKDSLARFGHTVLYGFTADFPQESVPHAKDIRQWLVDKVADSQSMSEEVPPLNAAFIGYAKRPNGGWKYKGDTNDHPLIAKFASTMFFAIIQGEYGTDDENYPSYLFSDLNLQAKVQNGRLVTYQQYTHNYDGGIHGYYTEKLFSYDHVHGQEIDFGYLFKSGCEHQLLEILIEVARNHPLFEEWKPDVCQSVCVTDNEGNPTGELHFPQPGLSEDGVVFSFQPYEISCFAAGTFHYTIPYDKLRQLLTPRGKWCVGL